MNNGNVVAVSGALWRNGAGCGACYKVDAFVSITFNKARFGGVVVNIRKYLNPLTIVNK